MPLVHHELCFGCGRANLFGLLLEAEPAGRRAISARFFVKQDHQGPRRGIAHDAVIAGALSEAMAFACGAPVTTVTLEVRCVGDAPVGHFIDIEAGAMQPTKGEFGAQAAASVDGRPLASASGIYRLSVSPGSGAGTD